MISTTPYIGCKTSANRSGSSPLPSPPPPSCIFDTRENVFDLCSSSSVRQVEASIYRQSFSISSQVFQIGSSSQSFPHVVKKVSLTEGVFCFFWRFAVFFSLSDFINSFFKKRILRIWFGFLKVFFLLLYTCLKLLNHACGDCRQWRRGSAAPSPWRRTRSRSPRRSTTLGPECAASQAAGQRRTDGSTRMTRSRFTTTTAAPNTRALPTDEWLTGWGPAHVLLLTRSPFLALTSRTSKQKKILKWVPVVWYSNISLILSQFLVNIMEIEAFPHTFVTGKKDKCSKKKEKSVKQHSTKNVFCSRLNNVHGA